MTNPSNLSYRERVLPSLASLWPLLLVVPLSYLTFLPFASKIGELGGVGIGVFVVLAVLVSIWFASPLIEIDESGFAVGDSVLPLSVIAGFEIVEPARAFEERGRNLDPAAYIRFQLSVNSLIKIQLDDPADSTPYWLIATRNPATIANTLQALSGRSTQ